jgi:hypothetical protein
MESTVTELLREFPRVRRAVFAGETVIIKSREGNMRLTLDTPVAERLLGCLKGLVARTDNDMRDGATEGRPEGRDERDRASQIERIFTNVELLRRRICLRVLYQCLLGFRFSKAFV